MNEDKTIGARRRLETQCAGTCSWQPQMTVWYGAMPETNGKSNYTAILYRKGGDLEDGITLDRSEYPDRVRYEADRARFLIGEIAIEPNILDYDADAHSGYKRPPSRLELEVDTLKEQLEWQPARWSPIEDAPRNNERPLLLAYFSEDGQLQAVDFGGRWESGSESWELPQIYYYWESMTNTVDEPTHWAYQPSWFDTIPPYREKE